MDNKELLARFGGAPIPPPPIDVVQIMCEVHGSMPRPFDYPAFITELTELRNTGSQLFNFNAESNEFRRWHGDTHALYKKAHRLGYPDIPVQDFRVWASDFDYRRSLMETLDEMRRFIESYGKYGVPATYAELNARKEKKPMSTALAVSTPPLPVVMTPDLAPSPPAPPRWPKKDEGTLRFLFDMPWTIAGTLCGALALSFTIGASFKPLVELIDRRLNTPVTTQPAPKPASGP